MVEDKAYQATPDLTLERQIMDSNIPKNEREWWARNEIERLRDALNEAHHQLEYWQKMALLTNSEAADLQQKEIE